MGEPLDDSESPSQAPPPVHTGLDVRNAANKSPTYVLQTCSRAKIRHAQVGNQSKDIHNTQRGVGRQFPCGPNEALRRRLECVVVRFSKSISVFSGLH